MPVLGRRLPCLVTECDEQRSPRRHLLWARAGANGQTASWGDRERLAFYPRLPRQNTGESEPSWVDITHAVNPGRSAVGMRIDLAKQRLVAVVRDPPKRARSHGKRAKSRRYHRIEGAQE